MRFNHFLVCIMLLGCTVQEPVSEDRQAVNRIHRHENSLCACPNVPEVVPSKAFPRFCVEHGGSPQLGALGDCVRCGAITPSCSHLICVRCAELSGDCQTCGKSLLKPQ